MVKHEAVKIAISSWYLGSVYMYFGTFFSTLNFKGLCNYCCWLFFAGLSQALHACTLYN